jgi:raffinose/stachyose/melibiose transport system substrate-binding protein
MLRHSWRVLAVCAIVMAIMFQACGGATGSTGPTAGSGGSPGPGTSAEAAATAQEEVVFTCTGCEASDTDIFIAESHRLAEAFNEAHKGRYRVEYVPFAGVNDEKQLVPYLKRLATNDQLPDLIVAPAYLLKDLGRSGRLVDWTPMLSADPAWNDGFYEDAFTSLRDSDGHTWGIPRDRNSIGIFYNKTLFEKAGVGAFPATWDELVTAAQKLKDSGVTPFAMDGLWITQLWWSNFIGTQPGGPEFLASGITQGNFYANPAVVLATERLKKLHTDGFVNSDAFSGDFFPADVLFTTEKAAMLANGPWEIPCCIKGDTANKGLIDRVAYSIAPDGGVIAVAGSGSFGSGAKTEAVKEAATAFMKFMTTKEQALAAYQATGAGWPFKIELTNEDKALINPVELPFNEAAENAAHTYVHAFLSVPASFQDEWKNNWPAYVQGALTTEEFLDKISAAGMKTN